MALTADFANLVIHSDASITDMVAFHLALRGIEDGADAIIYPAIHTYKAVALGGGAIFPAVAFVNGWALQFPVGNWVVKGGNLDCTINPVPGAYIERTQSSAYAVTSIGAGGATPDDIAAAVWANPTGAQMVVKLAEAWGRLGLDPAKPLVTGQTSVTFGDIAMALTGDATSTTVTRQ